MTRRIADRYELGAQLGAGGSARVFAAQLDLNPTLVGAAGPVLADTLRTLLDESSSRKQRDQAKSLRKEIEKWAENGQLDPLIADALDALLQPISGGPPNK